jgi:hypothetical protein
MKDTNQRPRTMTHDPERTVGLSDDLILSGCSVLFGALLGIMGLPFFF